MHFLCWLSKVFCCFVWVDGGVAASHSHPFLRVNPSKGARALQYLGFMAGWSPEVWLWPALAALGYQVGTGKWVIFFGAQMICWSFWRPIFSSRKHGTWNFNWDLNMISFLVYSDLVISFNVNQVAFQPCFYLHVSQHQLEMPQHFTGNQPWNISPRFTRKSSPFVDFLHLLTVTFAAIEGSGHHGDQLG